VVVVAGCSSLQTIATTPQQRLFAAYGDYIAYGEVVRQAVKDPLTLPATKKDLKEMDHRVFMALEVARKAYEAGDLTDVTVLLAETALRELRHRLIAEGRMT
jgi:hypothetical protein